MPERFCCVDEISRTAERRMKMYEIKKDGVLKMSTESEKCIYTKEIRAQIRRAGFKIYKDGKIFKE